ncbi:MAG: hypothetical protein ICV77_08765, partial [Cyanobacteria bacterium Co-bin8]|nr:hypothetical protein [Cyanobacteria bacterium Co-bin8]
LIFLAAIAPTLDLTPYSQALLSAGWQHQESTYPTYQKANAILRIAQDAYAECLDLAMGAIATAGTATEQLVGLGKPAFTFAGEGPQFTRTFAEVQARLLGKSIQLLPAPDAVGPAAMALFADLERLEQLRQNGQHRMGQAGGGDAIAARLLQIKWSDDGGDASPLSTAP